MSNLEKLDNPIWFSLLETHRFHAIGNDSIKFYQPDYCPFGGMVNGPEAIEEITNYATLTDSFFIVGGKPTLPAHLRFINELVCWQMVYEKEVEINLSESITHLTQHHHTELCTLVNLVLPGYFKKRTATLGNYSGIFKNGNLVAAAGERIQMDQFIEVSAVVTHPDFTGKGFAKQLVAYAVQQILLQHKIPFLHVAATNAGAIELYIKSGFVKRREISFWHIGKR